MVVPEQGAEAIAVVPDTAEATPTPLILAMQSMLVKVASPECPIPSNCHPATASPASEHPHLVLVPSDSPCLATPEPPSRSVNTMASPHVPIRPDVTPMTMPEPPQNAKTICDRSNSAVLTPEPSVFAVQTVSVMVAPP